MIFFFLPSVELLSWTLIYWNTASSFNWRQLKRLLMWIVKKLWSVASYRCYEYHEICNNITRSNMEKSGTSSMKSFDWDMERKVTFWWSRKSWKIYSKSSMDGIDYFSFYLQIVFTSKLVFKQGLSNYVKKVFTVKNLYSQGMPTSKMVFKHSKIWWHLR